MKTIRFRLLFLWLMLPLGMFAQDLRFSQFDLNPIYYNPAFTGDARDMRVGLNYRNHWPNVPGRGFPGPFSSYNLYADKQLNNALVGGVGLFMYQDFKGEGYLRHTQVGGSYSWRMPTGTPDFNMYFGTKVSYNQLSVDWSRFVFSDQVSADSGYLSTPSAFIPQNSGNKSYVDIDAGMVMRFNLFKKWSNELSFSTAHLSTPNVSLNGIPTTLPLKYVAMYNTSFPLRKEKLYLNPKFMLERQRPFTTFTTGFNIYVTKKYNFQNNFYYSKPLYLGFYFQNSNFNQLRNTSSFIVLVGHTGSFGNNNSRYQMGLSYDFSIAGLSLSTYGALELSATIVLNTKNQGKRWRKCHNFQGNPLGPIN